jgi:hypothetical protein
MQTSLFNKQITHIQGPVLVEVFNYKLDKSEWFPGLVTGAISGEAGEDFERINVKLTDGREFRGCHPDCVKQHLPF